MEGEKGLTAYQTGIMAVSAGICVANIYYIQPLLHDIASGLHVSDSAMGSAAVLAQVGYGIGLLFITPLGDKVNRRKLILLLQLILVFALLGMTFSKGLSTILAMSLLIGFLSVAAQVILPLAAFLSVKNKGRTVGNIFTGILAGILAARVFSGFVADWLGWRYVYGLAAGLVFVSSVLLYRALPDVPVLFKGTYSGLVKSTLQQVTRFPLLRHTALLGGLMFGAFCSFWTNLTLHLSGSPFYYSTDTIGLFGILAIASVLLAPVFGKLADKGVPRLSQLMGIIIVIAGIVFTLIFPNSLWAILLAVLLLDIGVQAVQVTNVAVIYTLDEHAHSRINTVYMTSYFLGGALGTFTGLLCWKAGGWQAVCIQLLLLAVSGALLAIGGFRKRKLQQATIK
ncbi:MFS transporter [Olivibacter sitiensis]|uniref:MFS transporter n=1 Tax=Olivibacter sitiensis TaxID=376470 RepID=UPI0004203438|nr:MFS transporter [Olivibacter sitiensis]